MICFILQGSKRVALNDDLLSYDSEQYFISALDLPLIGQILDAEGGSPTLPSRSCWIRPYWRNSRQVCRRFARANKRELA